MPFYRDSGRRTKPIARATTKNDTRERGLIARALEEVLNQGIAAGEGQQKNLFDHIGAAVDTLVDLICFSLFCGHNSSDVFQKINAALFACTAFALFVLASGALVTQRGMASLTKARDLAGVRPALRAFDHALRRHGRAARRFQSSSRARSATHFRRYVAGFAGRETSTHTLILAGEMRR